MTNILESNSSGPVRRIWLNRPHKRNALCRDLVLGLSQELQAAALDPAVRVVVLSGRGGVFCAGGDLDELSGAGADTGDRLGEFHELILSVVDCPVPVVAGWEGAAAGFGGDLALAADLRLGSPTTFFQASFVHVGLIPDGGGTFFLPDLVGAGRAFEWLSLGERIEAARLADVGVVNRVFESDYEREVDQYVSRLAEKPPLALRNLKSMMREGRRTRLLEALAASRKAQIELIQSDDFREGVSAFREKRKPTFLGR
jgi:2-(1,2-epoxy-1,2-dihydrophenyl)acetyl-CoA isomerase